MKKLMALTKRNLKEIIREPLSFVFCLGFPIVMLILMQIIAMSVSSMPDNFQIVNYSVGICVFGYTFTMLYIASLISEDKHSAFYSRINMAPISKFTYFISYILAGLPIMLFQTILFFLISLIFGLNFSFNILVCIIYLIPSMIFYLSLGMLFGILCKSERQTGPISSIVISLAGMFGGVFMPIDIMGTTLVTIANILPFSHTIKIASGTLTNDFSCIYPHIIWVIGYTIIIWLIAYAIYRTKKNKV